MLTVTATVIPTANTTAVFLATQAVPHTLTLPKCLITTISWATTGSSLLTAPSRVLGREVRVVGASLVVLVPTPLVVAVGQLQQQAVAVVRSRETEIITGTVTEVTRDLTLTRLSLD
jgi:hypothetical protein